MFQWSIQYSMEWLNDCCVVFMKNARSWGAFLSSPLPHPLCLKSCNSGGWWSNQSSTAVFVPEIIESKADRDIACWGLTDHRHIRGVGWLSLQIRIVSLFVYWSGTPWRPDSDTDIALRNLVSDSRSDNWNIPGRFAVEFMIVQPVSRHISIVICRTIYSLSRSQTTLNAVSFYK